MQFLRPRRKNDIKTRIIGAVKNENKNEIKNVEENKKYK